MKELIEEWIKNQDYRSGTELYRRFGSSAFMLKIFLSGESDFNRAKLLEQLIGLLPAKKEQTVLVQRKDVLTVLDDDSRKLSDRSSAPDQIKSVIKERKYLYATAREKHSNLKLLAKSGDEAKELRRLFANEIIEKFYAITEHWNFTTFYDETGRVYQKVNSEVDYSGADVNTLNKTWLKNYKYVKRAVNSPQQKDKVGERCKENYEIKTHLLIQDAFYHDGLTMPEVRADKEEKVKEPAE
jgi:hypothetical protein